MFVWLFLLVHLRWCWCISIAVYAYFDKSVRTRVIFFFFDTWLKNSSTHLNRIYFLLFWSSTIIFNSNSAFHGYPINTNSVNVKDLLLPMDLSKVNFPLLNYTASFILRWFGWLEKKIDHLCLSTISLKILHSGHGFGDTLFILLMLLVCKFVRILIFRYEITPSLKIYGHYMLWKNYAEKLSLNNFK